MNASIHTEERPFAAVLNSILANLQDIVRSELRLVKTGAQEQLADLSRGLIWLGIGVVAAFFALCFALLAAYVGLLRLLPDWAAALVMVAFLVVVAATAIVVYRGKRRGPSASHIPTP